MAPRAPTLLSLVSSTSYPPLPNVEELEQLRSAIEAQAQAAANRLAVSTAAAAAEEERRNKKDKKRKDREATDERERAALAANHKAGAALEAVERRRMETPGDVRVKNERISPAPSNASSASFRPQHNSQTYGSSMMKKKKVKRVLDSEDEGSAHPTPPPHTGTSGLKLKLAPGGHNKSRPQSHALDPSPTPSASGISSGPGGNIDWSVPPNPQRPLVPPRPGVQKPLKGGPKRQADVNEDFSDKKAPSQIAVQTFWQNIEPYIRDVREDDLAMLNFKADTPDSYIIPQRGRHYTDIWDEEDGNPTGSTSRYPIPSARHPPNGVIQPIPHTIPTEMRDINLIQENRGLGALTERVVAAVIGGPDIAEVNKEAAEKKPEPEESSREGARVDVVELEEKVKKELRTVMLLGEHEEFNPADRDDDDISSSLRQCQRLLAQQVQINDARKAKLAKVARDRLAYGEYQTVLDEMEKQIESSWAKRVKKYGSGGKQVIKDGVISGQGRPVVPDSLKQKLSVRDRWIHSVGKTMRDRPAGEVVGLPVKSIFEGIGNDTEEKDEKAIDESMEVDEMDADEVDGMAV